MDSLPELPMGFGMALLQNERSYKFFQACTETQKNAILSQTHMIDSKAQMKAFIENLPSAAL